jgi:hypothetical protein
MGLIPRIAMQMVARSHAAGGAGSALIPGVGEVGGSPASQMGNRMYQQRRKPAQFVGSPPR